MAGNLQAEQLGALPEEVRAAALAQHPELAEEMAAQQADREAQAAAQQADQAAAKALQNRQALDALQVKIRLEEVKAAKMREAHDLKQAAEEAKMLRAMQDREHKEQLALRKAERTQAEAETKAHRAQEMATLRRAQARREALHGREAKTPVLTRTHVGVAAGADVRVIDALLAIGISAATVLWTATRTPTGSILWAVFWTALGGLMAVEGRGELRYAGFGVACANAAYASERVFGIAKA